MEQIPPMIDVAMVQHVNMLKVIDPPFLTVADPTTTRVRQPKIAGKYHM
jgi:hypothetical protein